MPTTTVTAGVRNPRTLAPHDIPTTIAGWRETIPAGDDIYTAMRAYGERLRAEMVRRRSDAGEYIAATQTFVGTEPSLMVLCVEHDDRRATLDVVHHRALGYIHPGCPSPAHSRPHHEILSLRCLGIGHVHYLRLDR